MSVRALKFHSLQTTIFDLNKNLDPTHQLSKNGRRNIHFWKLLFFQNTNTFHFEPRRARLTTDFFVVFSGVTFEPRLLVGLLKPSDKGFKVPVVDSQGFIRDSFKKGSAEDRSLS